MAAYRRVYDTSPAGWVSRTWISSGTLRSVIEYRLPLPLPSHSHRRLRGRCREPPSCVDDPPILWQVFFPSAELLNTASRCHFHLQCAQCTVFNSTVSVEQNSPFPDPTPSPPTAPRFSRLRRSTCDPQCSSGVDAHGHSSVYRFIMNCGTELLRRLVPKALVWTTCLRLLVESETAVSRNHDWSSSRMSIALSSS